MNSKQEALGLLDALNQLHQPKPKSQANSLWDALSRLAEQPAATPKAPFSD